MRQRFLKEVPPRMPKHSMELVGVFVVSGQDGKLTYLTRFPNEERAERLGLVRCRFRMGSRSRRRAKRPAARQPVDLRAVAAACATRYIADILVQIHP
jgi:hypothetical protein